MGDELRKVRFLLVCMVLLAVSGYFGFEEIAYFVNGKETSATVTKVTEVTRRGSVSRQVEFMFTEPNGTPRTGEDTASAGWTPPAGGVIQVRYTPGANGRARFAGRVNWIGIGMFVVAIALCLFFGLRLLFQARSAVRRLDDADRPRKNRR
jgi:hypothetical protein